MTVTKATTTLELRAAELQRQSDAAASKLNRTMTVLRYYGWVQIARRATSVIRRRLIPSQRIDSAPVAGVTLNPAELIQHLAHSIIEHRKNHPSHVQVDLESGHFVLLNHAVKLYDRNGFNNHMLLQQTHLWRFQFHYHEFLLTAVAAGQWLEVESFLNKWLNDFSVEQVRVKDDAWHPYCISRRIVAWVWLLYGAVGGKQPDRFSPELTQRLLIGIVQQCEHLSTNLERDLGGNHLLENVTALAIAGSVIGCEFSLRWRTIATSVLEQQLPRQILSHGEHFERSPIYHGHVLGNLLRVEACGLVADADALVNVVQPYLEPMLQHLAAITHPDGEVPLFADSVFAESPSVSELLSTAQLNGREIPDFSTSMDQHLGGYRILQNDQTFAICDFGDIAADNLPAHGHCDALNLEVSVEGQRWIIDSGNYNYSDDSMRHYCRSSIAHNVVTASDLNQATVWDKFRMGQRPSIESVQRGSDDDWQWAAASHDGYRQIGIDQMRRIVALSNTALACCDNAFSRGNRYTGTLAGYLHFHPDVAVALKQSDPANRVFTFEISRSGTLRYLTILAQNTKIEEGWFCPEFGRRLVSSVIRYDLNETADFLGWVLHEPRISCEIGNSQSEPLITMGGVSTFGWSFARSAPIQTTPPSDHHRSI